MTDVSFSNLTVNEPKSDFSESSEWKEQIKKPKKKQIINQENQNTVISQAQLKIPPIDSNQPIASYKEQPNRAHQQLQQPVQQKQQNVWSKPQSFQQPIQSQQPKQQPIQQMQKPVQPHKQSTQLLQQPVQTTKSQQQGAKSIQVPVQPTQKNVWSRPVEPPQQSIKPLNQADSSNLSTIQSEKSCQASSIQSTLESNLDTELTQNILPSDFEQNQASNTLSINFIPFS